MEVGMSVVCVLVVDAVDARVRCILVYCLDRCFVYVDLVL